MNARFEASASGLVVDRSSRVKDHVHVYYQGEALCDVMHKRTTLSPRVRAFHRSQVTCPQCLDLLGEQPP